MTRPSEQPEPRIRVRPWVALALTGSVSLGVAALVWPDERPTVSTVERDEANPLRGPVSHAQLALSSSEGLCRFEPGARMAYEVETQTEADLDVSRAADQAQTVQVAASSATKYHRSRHWRLELVALAHDDPDSSLLAARIDDRGLEVYSGEATGTAADPALAQTFLIRVDPRCAILEFGWREGAALEPTHQQQVLADGLGFWAPERLSKAGSYAGHSFDGAGRYAADYRYQDGQIQGEVTSFSLGEGEQRGVPVAVELLTSKIEVELHAGAWFETLTYERDLEFVLAGEPFGDHFQATKAERVEAGEFAGRVDLDDGGWRFGRVAAPQREPSEAFDPKLRELSIDDVLVSYRDLVEGGQLREYGHLLRDWLRANPEQTGSLLARLREGAFDGEQVARSGLFYALGSANTEEAKAALVDILREWPSVSQQLSAAHALAMVEQPNQDMLDLLSAATLRADLHPIERSSMALALGGLAGEGHKNTELAEAARGQLGEWLAQPADAAQISHGLLAVGNAGHDGLASAVDPYFAHEDPQIRRQATRAVRGMSPDEAFPRLERALADEDERVRTSALDIAANVARLHDARPDSELVEFASQSLDASTAESRAAISLLGQAAEHGDERAGELLRQRLHAQLDSEARDPAKLAALGQSTPGHWRPR